MARSPRNPKTASAKVELGGGYNWAFGGGRLEFVPKLAGIGGLVELQRMWETDETMGAMSWAINATLSQVVWAHTPQKDGKQSDDPEAIRMADFADSLLLDMDHDWHDHVDEAMTMIPMGFAPCEIVTKQRLPENSRFPDSYYGISRLPLRDQLSVSHWNYDAEGRDLVSMSQGGMGVAGRGDIPMWKLLHYRTTPVLNNPWGRSMILNAHRPWYLKRQMQDSEAIGIFRELAGMPTFYIPKSDIDAAAKLVNGVSPPSAVAAQERINAAIKAVRDMRFNEAGGLVIPSDVFKDGSGAPSNVRQYEFKLITSGGQRTIDVRAAIRDNDRSIARILLFQFLHLGERSGGSYALSDNQSDLALRSLRALTLKVSREYNRKSLPLIWAINGFDPRYMPMMEPSPIAEDGLDQLGIFLDRIANAEPLFLNDPELKRAVLNRAGLTQAKRQQAGGDPDAVARQQAAIAAAAVVENAIAEPANDATGTG